MSIVSTVSHGGKKWFIRYVEFANTKESGFNFESDENPLEG